MHLLWLGLLLISSLLQAQPKNISKKSKKNPHTNIVISTFKQPNEPSIAVHSTNNNILMAGANISNLYVSEDAGVTWKSNTLRSTYGVWGDPVIVADTAGRFYFFHLSNPPEGNWIDRIVCQRTDDNGKTWTNGSYMGLNGKKAQDKHWAAVDPATNYLYATWTQFDKYNSSDPKDKSSIQFAMSKDGATTWTLAKKINEQDGDCLDGDNTTEGAVPCIGPNGEVYVTWAGPLGLMFDRSLDGGETWLDKDVRIDPMPSGWEYKVPGIYRSNGLPVSACDRTGGAYHGTIYVNWTDQRNGADDTDVWLAKSTDQGNTWSKPIRVNDDKAGNHQFFTWMSLDPTNGYLYFVFYDRRGLRGDLTNVYMARSTDGGATFVNFKINDKPFSPNDGIFFGDYNNLVAKGDLVRPVWTRLDGMELSIKTALIDVSAIPSSSLFIETTSIADSSLNDPNVLYTSFKLPKAQKVSWSIYNRWGQKVTTIFKCKTMEAGKHIHSIKFSELDLIKGEQYYHRVWQKKKIYQERAFIMK